MRDAAEAGELLFQDDKTGGNVINMPRDDLTTNLAGLTAEVQEFEDPFVKPCPFKERTILVKKKTSITREAVEEIIQRRMSALTKNQRSS